MAEASTGANIEAETDAAGDASPDASTLASEGLHQDEFQGSARSERFIVTVALLLTMSVAALEQTVVSPAMPTIITQLHGLDIYPWVFSAYLLASTVTAPIYGKLADLLGRKRVLLFGLGLFSAGSVLSGYSQSMPQLIAMRVLQGLGGGALGPLILTMLADLYGLKERAKVQGYFSAVWGGASLVGPALGGALTDYLSWRWVFFVTVPFSAVAGWILVRHVHETREHKPGAPIDYAGATLLTLASTALLLAVLGQTSHVRLVQAVLLAFAALATLAFVRQERRAADPVLPLDLVVERTIAASIIGSFLIGGLLFGIDTYVPLYVQGVLGGTATQAGRAITPMFVAWSLSVMVATKVVMRIGFRATAVFGSVLIALGSGGLAWATAHPRWAGVVFLPSMIVIGIGLGPSAMAYVLGVQNTVPWSRRGVATGAVVFFRTMGGALGVGLLGATLGLGLAARLADSRAAGIDVAKALRPETHKDLSSDQLALVQEALGESLHNVFLELLAMAAVGIACSARLASGRAVDRLVRTPAPSDEFAEPGL